MEKAERAAMKTLPRATPPAKTKLFSNFRPKSTRLQASARFSMRWRPGISGMGTRLTVRRSWVAAMSTTAKGASAVTSPSSSTSWEKMLQIGVRSTMALAVVDPALDEAELRHGQDDDQQHQDDALRRR